MKVLVGVLLCVSAVYADGGHPTRPHGGYLNLETPHPGCHYIGQFLRHPSDECKFLRCDYGNEPWKNAYGQILLFAREMRCANGLSVGYGYHFGYSNPCNTPNKKCFVHPVYRPVYKKEVETKAVFDSFHDAYPQNQVHEQPRGYDSHPHEAPTYETHDPHPKQTYEAPATYEEGPSYPPHEHETGY